VAWLCVLLAHAWLIFLLARLGPGAERQVAEPEIAPITLFLDTEPSRTAGAEARPPEPTPASSSHRPTAAISVPALAAAPAAAPAGAAAESPLPGRVDWPIEGRKSASRVLAAEAEAARVAKRFSGPDGTWASLTPREKSRLRKFRWKPGVDGLEYDDRGNAIYHISEGCVVVNLLFIGCTLGKEKVHGDLFDDMRLYFDEQRLPAMQDGDGTER
jgi:hypothetical protein